METVACDLCGSASATGFLRPADYLLDRPQVHAQLVRCTGCGLIYQRPRPTFDEIGEHYPPGYESYGDYRAQSRGGLLRLAYDHGMRKRCRYVTRHQPGGRLLDIGCAVGLFLVALREQGGWEVEGIELDAGAAEHARRAYDLTVHTGTLESAHLHDAAFDAVTLWDVLEHLHEPTSTLREVRRILRPGGTLVIRVPNGAAWDARLFGEAWAGYDAPRHLYVYSPSTLTATLEGAGFTVRQWDTSIGAWPVFALSTRFALARANASTQTQRSVHRFLYHPLTRAATAPLFSLPSLARRGPLLVMTAKVA